MLIPVVAVLVLAAGPAPKAAAPKDVVAVVNGTVIKRTLLDASIQAARVNPMLFGSPLQKSPQETAKILLEQLITAELLAQRAEVVGIAVTDEEVEASVKQTKAQFANDAEWKKSLKESHFTEDDIKNDARRQIAIKRLLERELLPTVPVVDGEAAKAFYDSNPFLFTEPEENHVLHILAVVDADMDAKKKDAAQKKMDRVLADLKAGKDFAALAKAESEDPVSREKGGDAGWVTRGEWPSEFVKAANALKKPGDLSPIVKTRFGLHVIKLIEKRPAKLLPFDDKLREEIVLFLDKKRQEDATLDYVQDLRAGSQIEIYLK